MKIEKELRPYKAEVLRNGTGTRFVCADSKKDENGNWMKTPYYTIIGEGVTCHIDEKNPTGIKIVVNKITSVTVDTYKDKSQTTIWASDVKVVEGNSTPAKDFAQIDENIPF